MNETSLPIVIDFADELLKLRDRVAAKKHRVVLIESCTAGLVSGWLGQIPGISQYLCGSLVVYRNDSKHRWLGIEQGLLDDPKVGPVSPIVTRELAKAALERTPEATVAAAITGHLGPNAPNAMDGRVFTCIVFRQAPDQFQARDHWLQSLAPADLNDWQARQCRQSEAAKLLLSHLSASIE